MPADRRHLIDKRKRGTTTDRRLAVIRNEGDTAPPGRLPAVDARFVRSFPNDTRRVEYFSFVSFFLSFFFFFFLVSDTSQFEREF